MVESEEACQLKIVKQLMKEALRLEFTPSYETHHPAYISHLGIHELHLQEAEAIRSQCVQITKI